MRHSAYLKPVSAELTYGIERIAMYIQGVDNVYDLAYTDDVTYGEVFKRAEYEFSTHCFDKSDVEMLFRHFTDYETESARLAKAGLPLAAYDYCLKCSHSFNMLDARGAISVTERVKYIGRVRRLARLCAEGYLKIREEMGFPLLKGKEGK